MTEIIVGNYYTLQTVSQKVINKFNCTGAGFTSEMVKLCKRHKEVLLVKIQKAEDGLWYGINEEGESHVDWWFPKEALIPTNKVDNVIEKIQWLYKNSTSQFEKRWVKE